MLANWTIANWCHCFANWNCSYCPATRNTATTTMFDDAWPTSCCCGCAGPTLVAANDGTATVVCVVVVDGVAATSVAIVLRFPRLVGTLHCGPFFGRPVTHLANRNHWQSKRARLRLLWWCLGSPEDCCANRQIERRKHHWWWCPRFETSAYSSLH